MADQPVPVIDVSEWTDDEWIAVLQRFPPNTRREVAERWVAEQREASDA